MRKSIALICLPILLSISSSAEDSGILKVVSPKLKQFLAEHSAASQTLVAVISESFSNRTVQLYYFYSDDDARPRALHYYPDDSAVGLLIRENQEVCDEYICLIFEILNSQGEKRFKDLAEQAKSGTVSKKDFARGIMRQEFQAILRVRGLLDGLKLKPKEKSASYYFKKFADCPDDFEKFLTYQPKGVTRDQFKEYEQAYDSLRKAP
jgi:hypothetical protein